jgi:6-hydroxycyclohex-1-ene-1-carbonyl-CoA dehydrogenase
MKAVRLMASGAPLEVQDVPLPEPRPGEVLVRVAGCGVCHTDVGFWRAGVATRHPLPLTLGHEISGTVERVSAGNQALLGREVIVPAVIPCGHCELCKQGRGNVCRAQLMPGNDIDGGFAEYVCVPARGLCVVADRGGYELAELSVIADAVTTPYQAIVRSGLRAGDLAVFVGVGGVGTYGVQIAAALGARVIAIDVVAEKLCAVANHGAALTIDSSTLDTKAIRKQVSAAASEWGVPAHSWKIYECSGHPAGQETAFTLLTYAATLMVIGFTLARIELRLSNLMALDATVHGTWGCKPELYPEALRLVTTGAVAIKPFIECHPLSTAPALLERVANHQINRRAILLPQMNA